MQNLAEERLENRWFIVNSLKHSHYGPIFQKTDPQIIFEIVFLKCGTLS
jgi:hypothetical protein